MNPLMLDQVGGKGMPEAAGISRKPRDGAAPRSGVSVVVPNFNHGRHLVACIGALLAQRRPPDEIILIDDASTDDSLAIIRLLARDEPRIRILANQENRGVVASVNIGLDAATGEFIAFTAADDITDADYLADALNCLKRHPEAALFCAEAAVIEVGSRAVKESHRPAVRPCEAERYFSPDETGELLRFNDHFIVTLTAVYRRDLLLAIGGFDPALGSTSDGYAAKLLALKHGFCFLPKVLAHWKVVATGYSRKTVSDAEAVEALIAESRQRMAGDSAFPHWYPRLFERRFRFATCRLALKEAEPAWDFVERVGAKTALDPAVFMLARLLPKALARFASLAWLTLRLRPYPLFGLARTALRRKAESRAAPANRQ
jgi:glycosyltransferase involved in cell wall biosynthesis